MRNEHDKYKKLREKAEKILQQKGIDQPEEYYQNVEKLVEELNVHQIELEMQNQELLVLNKKVEQEKQRYKELFDDAPVAYFTLNKTGNIINLNQSAAVFFSTKLEFFNKTSIFLYLQPGFKQKFTTFVNNVFESNELLTETLGFINRRGEEIFAKINARAYFDDNIEQKLCRCALADITDNIRMQQALHESEAKFRRLAENAQDVIYRMSVPEGKYEYVSPAAQLVFGTPPSHFYETPFYVRQILHPDYNAYCEKQWQKILHGEVSPESEYKIITPNNQEKFLHQRNVLVFDAENNPVAIEAIVTDVTKRTIIQQNLEESEARFRTVFKEDRAIKLVIDAETGQIIDANKSAKVFYGYNNLCEMFIQNINQLDYPQIKKQMLEASTKKKNIFVFKHQLANGEIRDVEVFSTPMTLSGRKVLFSIIHDITERIKATNALKASEEKFSLLTNNSFDIVSILDQQGNILYESNAAQKILGYPQNERIGKNVLEFVHPDDKEYIAHELASIGTQTKTVKYRFQHHSGNWVWLESIGKDFSDNPAIKGLIINSRDISIQKQKEQEIIKINAELKELIATKDKFFNIIAHDLKNPFSGILGFANLLLKNIHRYDEKTIDKQLTVIKTASQNTLQLLENLLEWARSQTNRIKFEPQTIDAAQFVETTINAQMELANKKNIALVYYTPETISLNADKNMLQTVLRNLISNAIKFTNIGGHVLVEIEQNQHDTVFTVTDSGVGIPPEIKQKLFKLEEKISTKGTHNETGTGLGLILCKEFIEKHNGKIWVESSPDEGTSFFFTIPNNPKS